MIVGVIVAIDLPNTFGDGIPEPNFGVNPNTNQLTAPAGFTMAYDGAGNLVNDTYTGQGQRVYDAENRLIKAWANSQWQTYSYDAEGRRLKRIVNGTETWQVHGLGGELLAEYAVNANPSSPQKEYGYRNGQLLITAEAGTTSAPAPSGLVATPPASGSSVTLNWSAASGATNYRVERKGAGGSFALVGTTTTTSFNDNGTTAGAAYLYKVCAANAQNSCTSAYSNIVLGAAVIFPTDSTITTMVDDPTGVTVTLPKVAHITELRSAVNAVRSLAGLSAATWTNPSLVPQSNLISKEDVRDLRDRLDEALTVLGVQISAYSDSPLVGAPTGTLIKGVHIRQLRERATKGIAGSGGGGGPSVNIHWLVTDQIGTPRMIFDLSGSLATVSRHDYLPFGEELFTSSRTTALGYTGDSTRQHFGQYERDNETGLDYAQSRYYSASSGRFVSPDDFSNDTALEDSGSWNLYAYARNNPLRYTDPNGEKVHVGTLSATELRTLLDDLNRYYGCTNCVGVDKDGFLTVNTQGLSAAVQAATKDLTDAINSTTWFAVVLGESSFTSKDKRQEMRRSVAFAATSTTMTLPITYNGQKSTRRLSW